MRTSRADFGSETRLRAASTLCDNCTAWYLRPLQARYTVGSPNTCRGTTRKTLTLPSRLRHATASHSVPGDAAPVVAAAALVCARLPSPTGALSIHIDKGVATCAIVLVQACENLQENSVSFSVMRARICTLELRSPTNVESGIRSKETLWQT